MKPEPLFQIWYFRTKSTRLVTCNTSSSERHWFYFQNTTNHVCLYVLMPHVANQVLLIRKYHIRNKGVSLWLLARYFHFPTPLRLFFRKQNIKNPYFAEGSVRIKWTRWNFKMQPIAFSIALFKTYPGLKLFKISSKQRNSTFFYSNKKHV